MSVKSVFLFAGAALAHNARKFGCGAPDPTEEMRAVSREFGIKEADARAKGMSIKADINVDVYFHSVASSDDTLISDDALQQQFDVLADEFSNYGVTMNYAGATKTVDANWAVDGDEMAMKSELRQGSYSDLNIYFVEDLGDLLGYCYFPTEVSEGDDNFIKDGCSVAAGSVPGGDAEGFNLGKTAIHETGHWFGLFHTFEGDGCDGEGDEVDDTPAQESASSGCPVGRDSCPDQEGEDPIHNFMDYTEDACYEEFTSGQNDRINSFWDQYRA